MNRISALELELEDDHEIARDGGINDAEFEDQELHGEGDSELDGESDNELDGESDNELDGESDSEVDGESDSEVDGESDNEFDRQGVDHFAQRFYELSLTDGESELEMAQQVDGLMREMEQEYFFKGLRKRLKGVGGSLLKSALASAAGALPIGNLAKLASSVARGDMKGLLGSLANTALSVASKHPALAVGLPALKALGFGRGGSRAPWRNFTSMAKDAYGQLAQHVDNETLRPATAHRVARNAFNKALLRAQTRTVNSGAGRSLSTGGRKRRRVVTLRRGDVLVVRVR